MKIVLSILFSVVLDLVCVGQSPDDLIVYTQNDNSLFALVDNDVSIFFKKTSQPVSEEQLSVFYYSYEQYLGEVEDMTPIPVPFKKVGELFVIRPDSLGFIEFRVKIDEKTELTKVVTARPISLVCALLPSQAKGWGAIQAAKFKVQEGLWSYANCCGFDLRCNISEFEIIRIGSDGVTTKALNTGGRFEEANRSMIQLAAPGDMYILRNIYHHCLYNEKLRFDDMIFDIVE